MESEGKDPPLSPPELYINRELSWLEFNARVLEEATSKDVPLLERVKFLAIFSSNLDEFFMVRVAGLLKMEKEGLRLLESPDLMDTTEVLDKIRLRTQHLVSVQYKTLTETILPALREYDVQIMECGDLSEDQRQHINRYFDEEISPVLTPLALDPSHPFPFLTNLGLYLVVLPKDAATRHVGDLPPLGFVEIPYNIMPRLIAVPSKTKGAIRFVLLEDVISEHLSTLFFGFEVDRAYSFRVTRNLDYDLLENEVVDLLKSIQKEVINREHQEVVRLEIEEGVPENILEVITRKLSINDREIFEMPKPLNLCGLLQLCKLPHPSLMDPSFNPRLPPAFSSSEDIFALIAKKDLLVHHPFESFYAVTELLASAAHDPNVLAIKMTLYRTAGDSPIIESLIAAAQNGKQVTAVVELKARFDESNNIIWARRLERGGVNVVFGFIGLKTHGKATLVVRRENKKLVRYVHLATGNYNSSTARLYTDIGILSADQKLGQDISTVFNIITGFNILAGDGKLKRKELPLLNSISMAPTTMRQTFLQHIEQEIKHVRNGGSGLIVAKMNALVDKALIDALYEASQAGVKIRMIVRGICCLRPGVKGISDNIEIRSIVDRFLEHSRIYYFQGGGEDHVFLSSADWMPRNMDRRIEICVRIQDQEIKDRIINEILKTYWLDNVKARQMNPDGTYSLIQASAGEELVRSQMKLIEVARQGGLKSIPYDVAIRYNPLRKEGKRPVAKRSRKKR